MSHISGNANSKSGPSHKRIHRQASQDEDDPTANLDDLLSNDRHVGQRVAWQNDRHGTTGTVPRHPIGADREDDQEEVQVARPVRKSLLFSRSDEE